MSVAAALASVLVVWVLAAAGAAGARAFGPGAACAGLGAAAAFLAWTEPPAPRVPGGGRRAALPVALGFAAGAAALPGWLALSWHAGRALGLAPEWLGPPRPPGGGPAQWTSAALLAPLVEELTYRRRLLRALRARCGAGLAVAASAAAFAAGHPAPWTAVSALLLGLALGPLALVPGGLAACVGIHAGLNAAALAGGVPPVAGGRSGALAIGGACAAALSWATLPRGETARRRARRGNPRRTRCTRN